jgi:hypothetical protein
MDEFSVHQFFADGTNETVAEYVPPEKACEIAKGLTQSLGAKLGTTMRVIITDGGDCCCFEWEFGKGIIFPKE